MKDFVITKALSLGQELTSHLGCPYFVQLLCRPWTLPHTLSDADIFHIVSALPPTTLNPQMLKILRPDLLMSVLYMVIFILVMTTSCSYSRRFS